MPSASTPTEAERRQLPLEQQLSLDEVQQAAFAELKKDVVHKVKDVTFSDDDLLKFLRARKFNVQKTLTVLKNYVTWYQQVTNNGKKFNGTLVPLKIDRVRHVLEQQVIMPTFTKDRDGYPILYMKPNHYFPDKVPTAELMRAVVYCLERMADDPVTQMYGFTFIADMNGWGWSNWETSYAKTFMGTVESRVSIRLRKFIVVDTPSWFGVIYAILRNFFSAKFANKWHFVARGSSQLDALIAPEALPVEFGGQATLDMPAFIKARYETEKIDFTEQAIVYDDKTSDIFAAPVTASD